MRSLLGGQLHEARSTEHTSQHAVDGLVPAFGAEIDVLTEAAVDIVSDRDRVDQAPAARALDLADRDEPGDHVAGMPPTAAEVSVAHVQCSHHHAVRERREFGRSKDVACPDARCAIPVIALGESAGHD